MTMQFLAALVVSMLSGGEKTDLVSYLPPRDYFFARKIEMSLEKMTELAARPPADPKAQVQQLLALCWLGEEAEALKSSARYPQYRQLLEEIAQGKKSADPSGFAQLYAARSLARIDGKKLPPRTVPSFAGAFGGFPSNPCVVALLRSQDPASQLALEPRAPMAYRRLLEKEDREKLFNEAEQLGNLQVDRIAFALYGDKNKNLTSDGYAACVRVSGKFNQAAIRDVFKAQGAKFQEFPASEGRPVFVCTKDSVLLALVGNSDLVVVLQDAPALHREEVLKAIISRSNPKTEDRSIRELFEKIPVEACMVVLGDAKSGGESLQIRSYAKRSKQGLQIEANLVFDTESQANEAEGMVKQAKARLKEWLPQAATVMALQQVVLGMKGTGVEVSPEQFDGQAILKSFDQIEASAKENKLHVKATIPEETWLAVYFTARGMFNALENMTKGEPGATPAPPSAAPPVKK